MPLLSPFLESASQQSFEEVGISRNGSSCFHDDDMFPPLVCLLLGTVVTSKGLIAAMYRARSSRAGERSAQVSVGAQPICASDWDSVSQESDSLVHALVLRFRTIATAHGRPVGTDEGRKSNCCVEVILRPFISRPAMV